MEKRCAGEDDDDDNGGGEEDDDGGGFVTGSQGRRSRQTETGKFKHGQTAWAMCSQLVAKQPLPSSQGH